MNKLHRKYKYYLPPILWVLVIFCLCSMSRNSFPTIDEWQKMFFDKLVHLIMYCVLSVLLIVSFIKQNNSYTLKRYSFLFAISLAALYGIFIELYQAYLITSRSGDYYDIIANITGSFIGLLGFYIVYGKPRQYI